MIVKQTQYYTDYRMICVERRSADKIFEFLVGVVTLMGIIHAIGHFSFVFSSIFRSF